MRSPSSRTTLLLLGSMVAACGAAWTGCGGSEEPVAAGGGDGGAAAAGAGGEASVPDGGGGKGASDGAAGGETGGTSGGGGLAGAGGIGGGGVGGGGDDGGPDPDTGPEGPAAGGSAGTGGAGGSGGGAGSGGAAGSGGVAGSGGGGSGGGSGTGTPDGAAAGTGGGPGGASGTGGAPVEGGAGTPDGAAGTPDGAASDTGGGGGGTAGSDASADTGDGPADGVAGSAGADAGSCGADGAPCANGAKKGLCKAGVCAACADPADDAKCNAAYGGGPTTYLCVAGACVAGNCHDDAACAGTICGLTVPSTCGKCTVDSQCKADPFYGAKTICKIADGTCTSDACPAPGSACAANPADFCCPTGNGNACVAGNCCSTADCKQPGTSCQAHVCAPCPAVGDGVYWVDPAAGNDTASTGSAQCPFKTLAKAFVFLGALSGNVQVAIQAGGVVSTASGEPFPITVPKFVRVKSGSTSNLATIKPPANALGVVLNAPQSGLSFLVVDGSAQTATSGVVARAGSDATTSIDHVVVKSFRGNGVEVQNGPGQTTGGKLAIGPGVLVTDNGTDVNRASGLVVRNKGFASITGGSGADKTSFSQNTSVGVAVVDEGALSLKGTPGLGGEGTVVANGNYYAGAWIRQTPGPLPTIVLDGLVAWANTAGHGIHIYAGSSVKVRNSLSLANAGQGIYVSYVGGTPNIEDIAGIDLGVPGDFGKNTVQMLLGQNPNVGGGICLNLVSSLGVKLKAAGNVFAGPKDCSTVSPGAITKNTYCGTHVDIGVIGPASNDIDTANCTHP